MTGGARGDCDSLKRVNSVLLACSFRARAAAVSKLRAEGVESLGVAGVVGRPDVGLLGVMLPVLSEDLDELYTRPRVKQTEDYITGRFG